MPREMGFLNILIVTFNCGRELIKPEVFAQHLVQAIPKSSRPDLIVLSLQEVAPIAYAFLGGSFLVPYLERIGRVINLGAKAWGEAPYVNLITRNVGLTSIMTFVREDLSDRIRRIETGGIGVGVHEMGNKGAVAVRLGYAVDDEIMELTFVAAHLAPMEDALQRRNEDWRNVVSGLVLTSMDRKAVIRAVSDVQAPASEHEPLLPESINRSTEPAPGIYSPTSHLFLAGDLNYRTSIKKPSREDCATYPQPTSDAKNPVHFSHLLQEDQLRQEMRDQKTCQGFTEASIDFLPTYKYSDEERSRVAQEEEGSLTTSRPDGNREGKSIWASHRWPSWCDRILYMDIPPWMKTSTPLAKMEVHKYSALPLMSTSDHRPVILSLSVPLRPIPVPQDGPTGGDCRLQPPYVINPQWRDSRTTARRKEIVVGVLSYIALTWGGRGAAVATIVGALGGWALVRSMLAD